MLFDAFFDEMVKLGAVSDEEAERAMRRYQALKENKPELGQVARYSALGGVVAPTMHVLGNKLKGEKFLVGTADKFRDATGAAKMRGVGRSLAGSAITGAVGMGMVPIARHWMDQSAEKSKLKHYMKEHAAGQVAAPGA